MINKRIIVTGAAGFIGFHLCERLIQDGWEVAGIDNISDYYDPGLKKDRLAQLGINADCEHFGYRVQSKKYPGFLFVRINLEDSQTMSEFFHFWNPEYICHLGAQAGVRYSIENPMVYVNSNIVGFVNILELAQKHKVKHLVYASSSSVYGLNRKMPFSTHDSVNHPVSLYAATKKSNELMAHVYSKIYNLPTTGLRFFTVYGPWGRPDMSPMLFADAITKGKPIRVFNYGNMSRDFTYVADVVEGVARVVCKPAKPSKSWDSSNPDPSESEVPYKLYNIGSSAPIPLMEYIHTLETALGKQGEKELLPMQAGDVNETFCDVSELERDFNFKPKTTLKDGLEIFAKWYNEYYNI